MMCSKSHKSGVTFIEIMLTIFMMGMILSTAYISQSTILGQLGRWSRSFRSTLALRELFIHTAQDRMMKATHPELEKKGSLEITYVIAKPKADSSLAKLEDLHIEKANTVWGQVDEQMISLLYKPEGKKEK